jgi:TetR/AcrR family transcriptional regulator, transcriptional repressor for nem operon
MRKSRWEAARTRKRIIETAAQEFRRNGIAQTGLADLMAAAGLTHGGFYRHFESKDQLVAEACAAALDSNARTAAIALSQQGKGNGFKAFVANYLSTDHRDDQSEGCALAALGSELVRADETTREMATAGVLKLVDSIAAQFEGVRADIAKRRALVALSTLVGALTLARIVTDPKLSTVLLREAAKQVAA